MSEIKRIIFGNDSGALGRNGYMKTSGVEVQKVLNEIWIEPVTSKGTVGRCVIKIPDGKEVVELIAALREVNGDLATAEEIEAARALKLGCDGDVEIDDDAAASRSEDGAYIQAWIWVPKDEV